MDRNVGKSKSSSNNNSSSEHSGSSSKKLRPNEDNNNDDSDDDNDDAGDDDDDADDSDADEEDESDMGRAFFLYADNLLCNPTTVTSIDTINKAEKALEKCIYLLLSKDSSLQKMIDRARMRNDGKVPPGSANVRRALLDDRFLLSSACVGLAKVHDIRGDAAAAMKALQDALVFFPRSCEANEFYARLLKAEADDASKLGKVEALLRKAAAAAQDLEQSLATLRPFAVASGAAAVGDQSSTDMGLFSGAPDLGRDLRYVERELSVSKAALESLSLLLCQSERFEEAVPVLLAQDFRLRLSRDVLCYEQRCVPDSDAVADADVSPSQQELRLLPMRVVDQALPDAMLRHLQHVFRPCSPFWKEHYYDAVSNASRAVGYFSYIFPLLDNPLKPRCSIEQIILYLWIGSLRQLMPEVGEATVAEWWVHSRPHCSGHQLHFDSDETRLEAGGKAQHPICSLVIFLGGATPQLGGRESGPEPVVGGPTLVTNQRLGGNLADKGWLCFPRCNRMVAFDAQYLHGVVPGRGPNPSVGARRLTFMVGFWKKIQAQPRGLDSAGPGQPFPETDRTTAGSAYTWHKEMALSPEFAALAAEGVAAAGGHDQLRLVVPQAVAAVWEPVEASTASSSASASASASSAPSSSSSSSSSSSGSILQAVDYNRCFQGF